MGGGFESFVVEMITVREVIMRIIKTMALIIEVKVIISELIEFLLGYDNSCKGRNRQLF